MAQKTLVGGTSYEIPMGRTLVGGTGYDITFGRTLVNGVGRNIFLYKRLGGLEIGTSVFLNVNGVSTEFLVVHQGKPSDIYDDSCNDTWLMAKNLLEERTWAADNSITNYANSDIHSYLNGEFLAKFDSSVQNAICQVKIPYYIPIGNNDFEFASGSNGLSAKVFLLSAYEVGLDGQVSAATGEIHDGAKLDFFDLGNGDTAKANRIAYYSDGSSDSWMIRTIIPGSAHSTIMYVSSNGYVQSGAFPMSLNGIRPIIIMPFETKVDKNFNIIV